MDKSWYQGEVSCSYMNPKNNHSIKISRSINQVPKKLIMDTCALTKNEHLLRLDKTTTQVHIQPINFGTDFPRHEKVDVICEQG